MLTDREWLRFVSFALVAGGTLGSAYTGTMALRGHSLPWALAAGVVGTGAIALVVHVALRILLDRASEPPAEDAETGESA